jgi:hypothetical protein
MSCLSLTVVIAGFSLLNVDGCLHRGDGPPQVVETKLPPAITTDFWGEFVASTDRDQERPDRGAVYIFVDPTNMLKSDASENCETSPEICVGNSGRMEVHIQRVTFDRSNNYIVPCKELPKTS